MFARARNAALARKRAPERPQPTNGKKRQLPFALGARIVSSRPLWFRLGALAALLIVPTGVAGGYNWVMSQQSIGLGKSELAGTDVGVDRPQRHGVRHQQASSPMLTPSRPP